MACTYFKTIAGGRSPPKNVGKPPARVRAGGTARHDGHHQPRRHRGLPGRRRGAFAVASFNYLAGKHFFDDTPCHRLTPARDPDHVLQCGDPSGTGTGGPTYQYAEENLASLGTT